MKLLVFTSNLICIPTCVAFLLKRWEDVFITSLQAICAIWYHSSHSPISFYADQISIWLLVLHTCMLATTNTITPFLFTLGFGYMGVVYSYGKINNIFCFDPNEYIADIYHASMHIVGIIIYSGSMIFFLPNEANGIFDVMLY